MDILSNSVFAILFVFIIIVTFHELGHYIAAKLCRVDVEVFSVGFGPELAGFNDRSGTRWRLAFIPLGGYVKMRGDMNAASMPDPNQHAEPGTLQAANVFQRLFIVAAGPFASFLLAPILIFFVIFNDGKVIDEPIVGQIIENLPADAAGLAVEDVIISVDGTQVYTFNELARSVQDSGGQSLKLEVLSAQGETRLLDIIPRRQTLESGEVRYLLGITPMREPVPLNMAFDKAVGGSFSLLSGITQAMGNMVTGKSEGAQVSGPVGIANMASSAAQQSFSSLLIFTAILSINLGILNLLPVPILDGGHILFLFFEMLTGRPVPPPIQVRLYQIGAFLLLALFLYATFSDIFL